MIKLMIGFFAGALFVAVVASIGMPQIDAVVVESIPYSESTVKYFVRDKRSCTYVYPHIYPGDTLLNGKPWRSMSSSVLEYDRGFYSEDSAKRWLKKYLND